MIWTPTSVSSAEELTLARDPHTHPMVLRRLAHHDDCAALVAGNPNTEWGTLWDLAVQYPEAVVSNPILPLLLLETPDLARFCSPIALEALSRYPACPPLILAYLAKCSIWHIGAIIDVWIKDAQQTPSVWGHGTIAAYETFGSRYLMRAARVTHDDIRQWLPRLLRTFSKARYARHTHLTEYQQGYWFGVTRIHLFLQRIQEALG